MKIHFLLAAFTILLLAVAACEQAPKQQEEQDQSADQTAMYIERGLEIIRGLRGYTSGLAVPVYLLDTPYGKIPMHPQTIEKRDDDAVYLRSWNGKVWREPNKRGTDR